MAIDFFNLSSKKITIYSDFRKDLMINPITQDLTLRLNEDSVKEALKNLILTNKGERLYMPDFGANIRQYLFDPNDDAAHNSIKTEINDAIKKYIPNLQVTELSVTKSEENENLAIVKIDYIVTTNALQSSDFVMLEL